MNIFSVALLLSLLTQFLISVDISEDLYLDPGSGSFILQIIIASFLGAIFLIKTYWKRIKNFFQRTPPPIDEEEDL